MRFRAKGCCQCGPRLLEARPRRRSQAARALPAGMVVGCAIGKVSMEAVSKSIIVFYIPMVIVLLLITYIPALCLWLPRLVLD